MLFKPMYCVGCTTSFMSLLKHETICDDVMTRKVSSHHMDLRSKGYWTLCTLRFPCHPKNFQRIRLRQTSWIVFDWLVAVQWCHRRRLLLNPQILPNYSLASYLVLCCSCLSPFRNYLCLNDINRFAIILSFGKLLMSCEYSFCKENLNHGLLMIDAQIYPEKFNMIN